MSEIVPPISNDWSTRRISDGSQSKNRSEATIHHRKEAFIAAELNCEVQAYQFRLVP